MKRLYLQKRKRIPRFWWDYNQDLTAIIIESDYQIIKTFPITKDADDAIAEAEKFIKDLNAGRLILKKI